MEGAPRPLRPHRPGRGAGAWMPRRDPVPPAQQPHHQRSQDGGDRARGRHRGGRGGEHPERRAHHGGRGLLGVPQGGPRLLHRDRLAQCDARARRRAPSPALRRRRGLPRDRRRDPDAHGAQVPGAPVRLPLAAALLCASGSLLLTAAPSRADWLQPDGSYREAQLILKMATRDTAGHADDPGRLDSLGVALLRLGRLAEAQKVFHRALALRPGDDGARASLGKLALFDDRLSEAESLLAGVQDDAGALRDLMAVRVRRGEYAAAAAMAGDVDQEGRVALLERMSESPIYEVTAGPDRIDHPWTRAYPVPLVRVKLNGQSVLMALDTGSSDLL